jgi:hypothetical protein
LSNGTAPSSVAGVVPCSSKATGGAGFGFGATFVGGGAGTDTWGAVGGDDGAGAVCAVAAGPSDDATGADDGAGAGAAGAGAVGAGTVAGFFGARDGALTGRCVLVRGRRSTRVYRAVCFRAGSALRAEALVAYTDAGVRGASLTASVARTIATAVARTIATTTA